MPGSVFLNTAIVSSARCSLAGSQPAMAAPTVPTVRHATTRLEMSFRIVTLLRLYREAIMVCRMATGVLAGEQQPLEGMRGSGFQAACSIGPSGPPRHAWRRQCPASVDMEIGEVPGRQPLEPGGLIPPAPEPDCAH